MYHFWFYFSVTNVALNTKATFIFKNINNQARMAMLTTQGRLFSTGFKPVCMTMPVDPVWKRIPAKLELSVHRALQPPLEKCRRAVFPEVRA